MQVSFFLSRSKLNCMMLNDIIIYVNNNGNSGTWCQMCIHMLIKIKISNIGDKKLKTKTTEKKTKTKYT